MFKNIYDVLYNMYVSQITSVFDIYISTSRYLIHLECVLRYVISPQLKGKLRAEATHDLFVSCALLYHLGYPVHLRTASGFRDFQISKFFKYQLLAIRPLRMRIFCFDYKNFFFSLHGK